jgi:large subunit ribosomal protein L4
MKTELYNQTAEVIGEVELPDNIFGLKMNPDLVQQVLEAQLGSSRKVLAHAKGRGEVRGGGKKPWKQKGTGRARHASIRSPIWKGGGVTFGPTKERNFAKKINKKMKRKALFMVLSSKIEDNQLLALDNFNFNEYKTKEAQKITKALSQKLAGFRTSKKKSDSILFITPVKEVAVSKAFKNLPRIGLISADSLNIKDILKNKFLILLKDAILVMEKTYRI